MTSQLHNPCVPTQIAAQKPRVALIACACAAGVVAGVETFKVGAYSDSDSEKIC